MDKLFSAAIFDVTYTGLGILFIPVVYKWVLQVIRKETLRSMLLVALPGILFVFVWLFSAVASSLWGAFMAAPGGGPKQVLIAEIWQAIWILIGLVFSLSRGGTLGADIGAMYGTVIALPAGAGVGFISGFLLGLLPGTRPDNLMDRLINPFAIGIFAAVFTAFAALLFVVPIMVLAGAAIGAFISLANHLYRLKNTSAGVEPNQASIHQDPGKTG